MAVRHFFMLACFAGTLACRPGLPSPNRAEDGFAFYLDDGWETVPSQGSLVLSPVDSGPGAPRVTLRLVPQRDESSDESKKGFRASLKRMGARLIVEDRYRLSTGKRKIERTEWVYADKDRNRLSQWLGLVDDGPRRIELTAAALYSQLETHRDALETLLRTIRYQVSNQPASD